jgi:sulfhydrogenase subunit beta (sulfur reductase)
MRNLILPNDNLHGFVESLKDFGDLYLPENRGVNYTYQLWDEFNEEITQEYLLSIFNDYNRTTLPPKQFFYPPLQKLLAFSDDEGYEEILEIPENNRIIYGVHSCDIHGMWILDEVFTRYYIDTYYTRLRRKTLIIGISCTPDEYCFCRSMGSDFVERGFDVFLSDFGPAIFVSVGTSIGDDMVNERIGLFRELTEEDERIYRELSNKKAELFTLSVELRDLPELMETGLAQDIWWELGDKCLSCGRCSMVCPTCYCYDVYDWIRYTGESGERTRTWDSCLFREHALVAGGHNFREARSERVKHRYAHKQHGFMEEWGRPSCVGCGRCIVACPVGINIVDTIKRLRGEVYERPDT